MPTRDELVGTVRAETDRLIDLLAGATTLDRRVPGLDWTVAQVAAHLFTVYGVFAAALCGIDVSSLFAETGEHANLTDRVARVNADAIARIGFDSPAHAAAELGAAAAGLLDAVATIEDLDEIRPTPWYGDDTAHRAATIVSLAGSETLVHARDIARGLGVRWRLSGASAAVVTPTVMREMLPYTLDKRASAGVRVTYDVHLRGAGALRVRVADGVATTGPVDADTGGVDCVLSLAPAAALLVGFRRQSVWHAVATGQTFASGRRPWWGPPLPATVPAPVAGKPKTYDRFRRDMTDLDVIVVGARPAGAATAMLLARAGLRVLAVDRARFPSDTLSSHQIQTPGAALLRRWGLLDRLGVAPVTRVRFDSGVEVLTGDFPEYDGGNALYSPRRTVLDSVLVDAARAAGAEVREEFDVVSVDRDRAGRVVGVSGRPRGAAGAPETIRAGLVVGADGKRSTVADAVGAAASRSRDGLALACYTYWAGLPVAVGELYQRPGRTVAVFPTNDDLTMVYVAAPRADLPSFRAGGAYLATLDACGDLGVRVRAASRAERYRIAPDQPNAVRRSHGPGWALAGDAGLVLDSITAQGISNALRDADRLATHVVRAATAGRPLDAHLRDYQRERDRARRAMYDFTVRQATFAPSAAADALFRALAGRPAEISRFLGVFAGASPMAPYFGAANMRRLLGTRTLARVALARLRGR